MTTVHETDVVVIGAGQAGLQSAYFLRRSGFSPRSGYVVLDGADGPGGAWQYRWPTLRFGGVHGLYELEGLPLGDVDLTRPAAEIVSEYFARYEREFDLPIVRPARVTAVRHGPDDRLLVESAAGVYSTRALVNATGTWTRPFWPRYPGQSDFAGRQLHTADYLGPEEFAGKHVVVVGGGTSAVELITAISRVTSTTWVTRRPPAFHDGPFSEEWGREAVAMVEEAVRAGRPPRSVVSVTGLYRSPEVIDAQRRGVLDRLPMFDRITPDRVRWNDGRVVHADVILWATGFRAAVDHLAPLGLRRPGGGIVVHGTRVAAEPRVHLVGYGPSASTIGANRAARSAVREIRELLGARRAALVAN